MRYAFRVFKPYRHRRKVSIFGRPGFHPIPRFTTWRDGLQSC